MGRSAEYKVLSRKTFTVTLAILLSLVAVITRVGLDQLAAYEEQLERLAAAKPVAAAEILSRLLRAFVVLNGAVLAGLTTWIIWHGWRGWRTESMPPKGSWIIEGQRTWTGRAAVRIARFIIAMGGLLGVLAVASSVILWRLADSLGHQT
ncbi:hypothetical protein Thimo_2938 [Thioflavicoccus mobilis 8321]|uniref:Uncharacterized protein n=1 Tax=Thioflavicoccus mobilis 8321 TaxID=765912 RepID=L0H1V3_9GAMM|nr:hypothetical protein [Thioflavicoccus mobilis]AGA91630.1 hypothetical protein Thimo_2938 [Thioflavicoccus mobilis 8321]